MDAKESATTMATLRSIAKAVHNDHPAATHFDLRWSDQGSDGWAYGCARVGDEEVPGSDELWLPWELYGSDAWEWAPWSTEPEEFLRNYERSPDNATFAIEPLLKEVTA